MGEVILGVFPLPEDPPEEIIVAQGNQFVTIRTDDIWAYSGDAMHSTAADVTEPQGDSNG